MEALRLLEALAYAHEYSSTEIAAEPHRVDAQAGLAAYFDCTSCQYDRHVGRMS